MVREKIKTIRCTCYACPTQYEGELVSGKYIYFRFRHGYYYVEIDNDIVLSGEDDQGRDGIMDYESVMNILSKVVDRGIY